MARVMLCWADKKFQEKRNHDKYVIMIDARVILCGADKKFQEKHNHDKYVIMIDGEGNPLLSW